MKNFDFNTIENFDEHIEKSIPNYDLLISAIQSISEYFFIKDANVYDLGCSTGKLLKSIKTECKKIGYDYSNLLPLSTNTEHFENVNLNEYFDLNNSCLVYSIFTMQFLNPDKRFNYIRNIYDGLNEGGALIICEKIYQNEGKFQDILSFSHYDYKLNSFSSNEILSKEKDLRYIMKPYNEYDLNNIIEKSGFSTFTTFWQMFNFKAIIAIK
jgi:tRNA (cmo5U34)-methyltransferase